MYKEFKVVTVSSNTNSFGLRGFICVARDGDAFQAATNSLDVPKKDMILRMPIIMDKDGKPTNRINYVLGGFEIPEKLDNCPADAVKEIWG
ncbi:MAG: hypothetical protein PF487_09005 [Bacteroidales bacterium]|jgi:hypothetical protein|nr:hypothetical protein [Bacteroidales bacterium]